MNRDEIKHVMTIARPAIWALYGRQQLRLSAYSETEVQYFSDLIFPDNAGEIANASGLFEVDSINREDYFKVEIKEDIVISLAIGELNV